MLNYLLAAFWAASILVIANAPLTVYRFFCGARSSKADAATEELLETPEQVRKRRLLAFMWGGLVPLGVFVLVAALGVIRVDDAVGADRYLAGLGLYAAALIVASAGAQLVAEVEAEHPHSPYIELGGKVGVLTTSAITFGMLLSEYGVDLVAGLGSA